MKQKLFSKDQPDPTRSELEILQVLWQHGPSTVRFVNDELKKSKEVQYTSTLKIMQLMHEKGLLHRDESAMKHLYGAAVEEKSTQRHLLEKFIASTYKGSASSLMLQLLGNRKVPEKELEAIKKLLAAIDKEK